MQLQHMELLRIKSRLDAVLADGSPEMRSFVAEVRLSVCTQHSQPAFSPIHSPQPPPLPPSSMELG
jgi:hypothetical protein